MAKNETNVMEKTENLNDTAINTETTETPETPIVRLYVERERYKSKTDGKEYWSYFTRGKVRGRDIKVDFSAKDKGGYEPLDIVFDVAPKAELLMHEEKQYDEKTGLRKFVIYELQTIDEDGIPLTCEVKLARNSDKSLLKMLFDEMAKTAKIA